jgi:PAS domain S-box-containing protein
MHQKPKILIVDDERVSIQFFVAAIGPQSYELHTALSGEDALVLLESIPDIDVILLDINMPGLDGFEVLDILKANPKTSGIKVIMLSGQEETKHKVRAFSAGAADYVVKPFQRAELAARIETQANLKQMEQALIEERVLLRTLIDNLPDSIYFKDTHNRFVLANSAAARQLGAASSDEIVGKTDFEFLPPELAREFQVTEEAMLTSGQPLLNQEECIIDHQTGQKQVFLVTKVPLRDSQGELVGSVGINRDITELKQMQTQMLASQKLADLGTLAAGVAHEINSPLQVITGISHSLLTRLQQGSLSPDYLERKVEVIQRNAWRCAEIVRALRTYGHAAADQIEPYDLNTLVQDTLLLIEHQLKSWANITITIYLAPNLPPLLCDRNQISQTLINLLTNAREAMPLGGEVILRTDHKADLGQINLQVADNGQGIPDEIRTKIFDPFFTTKPLGQGTGLGLSIVAGIVQAHGGEIKVDSVPGQGTTITLSFPEAGPIAVPLPFAAGGRFDEGYPAPNPAPVTAGIAYG